MTDATSKPTWGALKDALEKMVAFSPGDGWHVSREAADKALEWITWAETHQPNPVPKLLPEKDEDVSLVWRTVDGWAIQAAYLLQKLFRSIIGTNNTDCCARVCHSSTAVALGLVTGTGAATASYVDLDETSLVVLAGGNPTEAHPVIGARIKQVVLRGAGLVVIDPRAIELASYADVHLQLWPGTNVALFNALAKVIVEEELFDREYVVARCEGLVDLREFLSRVTLSELAELTRDPVSKIQAAARD